MRAWGTCVRTEGGVFMYSPKQPGDHRLKSLMNQEGTCKLAEVAVVAAPRRKL